ARSVRFAFRALDASRWALAKALTIFLREASEVTETAVDRDLANASLRSFRQQERIGPVEARFTQKSDGTAVTEPPEVFVKRARRHAGRPGNILQRDRLCEVFMNEAFRLADGRRRDAMPS